MDGLVTNIALVAGVGGGGGADRQTIILTGMAGLVAGAFSMALGEFASVDTQNDAVANEVRVPSATRSSGNPEGGAGRADPDVRRHGPVTPETAEAVSQ